MSPMAARALSFALVVSVCAAPAAAQQSAGQLPVSVERVREGLERTPAISLDASAHLPVTRFRTSVEEIYMLPFKEQFDQQFTLTPLQRQSAEWGSKCCGLDLGMLTRGIGRALRRREERKIRERVARELAAVQAAKRNAEPRADPERR